MLKQSERMRVNMTVYSRHLFYIKTATSTENGYKEEIFIHSIFLFSRAKRETNLKWCVLKKTTSGIRIQVGKEISGALDVDGLLWSEMRK